MLSKRTIHLLWRLYCSLLTLQFIRFYCRSALLYLNMPAYLSGHERLPFQERILPIFILKPLYDSRWVMHFAREGSPFSPERGPFYLLSLVSFGIAAIFVQKLHSAVSRDGKLSGLVFPVFLFVAMWSYVVHTEANFSYPYDMPSLAFFAAGLYFIYTRQFLPLLPILFFGTLNRETTLFLIGIFVLDAASTSTEQPGSLSERFSLARVPWLKVALLSVTWLGVKLSVAHIFAHNDSSEDYVRVLENVGRLKLRLVPALLNICGYLLPVVVLLRGQIRPTRLANYLYILPFWFAVMFYTGVIVETRIYGELCPFVAVALVVILERYTSAVAAVSAEPAKTIQVAMDRQDAA